MTDAQFDSLWAIDPARLATLQALHATHVRDAVERYGNPSAAAPVRLAGTGRDLRPQRYAVRDGVAVVAVRGVVTPRASWLAGFIETTALDALTHALRAALADGQVKALLLVIDSPGGAVAGVQTAARAVRALRGGKPIGALVENAALAGAYWIASAADPGAVWISADTSQVGAIGAVATHVDVSARESALGLTHTEVVAGQYKAIASPHKPLTEAGRATLQDQVDAIYRVFVQDVATHRGVSVQRVLDTMADGRTFLGDQAVSAGLVDGMTTFEDAIAQLAARARGGAARAPASAPSARPRTRSTHVASTPPKNPTTTSSAQGKDESMTNQAAPERLDATDSVAVDRAARAYQAAHPGTTYIAAVKVFCSGDTPRTPPGYAVDPASAEVDAKARAYMAAHPGATYIAAVRAVQETPAQQARA
jgi:signal peptide peptidase SppA